MRNVIVRLPRIRLVYCDAVRSDFTGATDQARKTIRTKMPRPRMAALVSHPTKKDASGTKFCATQNRSVRIMISMNGLAGLVSFEPL